jgi:HEPN domain-containing protein
MDEATLELTRGWLVKAQHDLATARKLAAGSDPYLDTAIYHCQQAAEKAIKGLLVLHGQRFEKVHNIQILLTQALPFAPQLSPLLEAAERLTPYATTFRYPGVLLEPDQSEFDMALTAAEEIYASVLALLPEQAHP